MLGVSSESLAQSLNTVLSGVDVTQIRDGNYLIDVVARSGEEERMTLATLRKLELLLPGDRIVPLIQIGTIEYGQELPLIWRRDRQPTLTVQADVAQGIQPETAVQALQPKIAAFSAKLPAGYRVAIGGSAEESLKSQLSVARRGPADAASDVDHPDVSAAEFPAAVSGPERRPARADRRGGGPARLGQAARLHRAARRRRADRDDRAKLGRPGDPDRGRDRGRTRSLERRDRSDDRTVSGRSC